MLGSSCNIVRGLKPDSKSADVEPRNKPDNLLQINVQDIYKKMPHAIIYNLGDSVIFFLGRSTYSCVDSSFLVVYVPITDDSLNYIYGAKYASNTNRTLVYAVRFIPDNSDSTTNPFSGRMEWINFQNWEAYGLKYQKGNLAAYMTPVILAKPGWETCLIDAHALTINQEGRIVPSNPDSASITTKPSGCQGDSSIFHDKSALFLGMQHLFRALFIENTNDSSRNWNTSGWLGENGIPV